MENNRYREEEKELELEKEQKNKESQSPKESFSESNRGNESTKVENEEADLKESADNHFKKDRKLRKKIEELEQKVATLEAEKAKLANEILKDRAELENFKRRTQEERIRDRKYALQDFLGSLIDIVDVFDKATSTSTDDEKLKKYLQGFSMINQQLFERLTENGVKKIEALNKPFDPSIHMAIGTVYLPDLPEHTVIDVITNGYLYKDRVLRPSMVKVSTKVDSLVEESED